MPLSDDHDAGLYAPSTIADRLQRRRQLAALTVTIAVLLAGALPHAARADGDPASDVLLSQPLFLPQDAGVSPTGQTQLASLLAAARRAGYELRVAVIAGPADLGSVTALWRQPQNYARFLGQELSLNYTGSLLVVMPDGYGFYRPRAPSTSEQSVLNQLTPPGQKLGTGALSAIERLAAATGHDLPAPTATTPASHSATDTLAWIVFAIGIGLIVLAWTASLRARPPRLFSRGTSSRLAQLLPVLACAVQDDLAFLDAHRHAAAELLDRGLEVGVGERGDGAAGSWHRARTSAPPNASIESRRRARRRDTRGGRPLTGAGCDRGQPLGAMAGPRRSQETRGAAGSTSRRLHIAVESGSPRLQAGRRAPPCLYRIQAGTKPTGSGSDTSGNECGSHPGTCRRTCSSPL